MKYTHTQSIHDNDYLQRYKIQHNTENSKKNIS